MCELVQNQLQCTVRRFKSTLWTHNTSMEYDRSWLSVGRAADVGDDVGSGDVLAVMGGSWTLPLPGSGSVSPRSWGPCSFRATSCSPPGDPCPWPRWESGLQGWDEVSLKVEFRDDDGGTAAEAGEQDASRSWVTQTEHVLDVAPSCEEDQGYRGRSSPAPEATEGPNVVGNPHPGLRGALFPKRPWELWQLLVSQMRGAQEANDPLVVPECALGEEAGVPQLTVDVWRPPALQLPLEENRPLPEGVSDVPPYESTSRCSFYLEGESPFWTISSLKVHGRTA